MRYEKPKGYRPILSVSSDAKTIKGEKLNVLTAVAYLAPHESSGYGNVCPMATDGCIATCLGRYSGHMVMEQVRKAQNDKVRLFFTDNALFLACLRHDIRKLVRKAKRKGMRPAVRINGSSDLPKVSIAMSQEFPDVTFYDYTKIPRPWTRETSNYHITFSRSENNERDCMDVLEHGGNVAVLFAGDRPTTWHGYKVIDGDLHDVRFLDSRNVVVGLRPKGGPARRDTSGFVVLAA